MYFRVLKLRTQIPVNFFVTLLQVTPNNIVTLLHQTIIIFIFKMEHTRHSDIFMDDILPQFKNILDRFDKFDNAPFVKELRTKIKFLQELLVEKRRPRFALLGRRGCGKSSFLNALLNSYQVSLGHFAAQTGEATVLQNIISPYFSSGIPSIISKF